MLDIKYITDIMNTLCSTASPSGYTHKAMDIVENELNQFKMSVSYTNKGSLKSIIKGKDNRTKVTLAAHIDTLGAMVKEITLDGKIKFTNIGFFTGASTECENCTIHSANNTEYSGTIYTNKPSVHVDIKSGTLERNLSNMEIIIDEKVTSEEDVTKLGIEIGDFISFDSRFKLTDSGFIKSRHLDDKAGVAIILGVCKYFYDNKITPEYCFEIFISCYEEVGHGASSGLLSNIEELLCIDMGAPGDGQNSDEFSVSICAKDSSGPYDFTFRKQLVEIAKKNNIKFKVDIYPHYSSDGSTALHGGSDIKVALIGPGVYASHSYERTHIDSIINTGNLVIEYIKSKKITD